MKKSRKRSRGYKTLAEHHAQLKAEGKWDEYVARTKARDDDIAQKERLYAEAETPVVADLHAVGATVKSVWDFVNGAKVTPAAVRVLLDHISRDYSDRVREGIARALSVPGSRVGWAKLVGLFVSDPDRSGLGSKFGLGCALAAAVDAEVLDEFIGLACDRRHGQNRIALLDGLAKLPDPKARAALQELADDPEVGPEVRRILSVKRQR